MMRVCVKERTSTFTLVQYTISWLLLFKKLKDLSTVAGTHNLDKNAAQLALRGLLYVLHMWFVYDTVDVDVCP